MDTKLLMYCGRQEAFKCNNYDCKFDSHSEDWQSAAMSSATKHATSRKFWKESGNMIILTLVFFLGVCYPLERIELRSLSTYFRDIAYWAAEFYAALSLYKSEELIILNNSFPRVGIKPISVTFTVRSCAAMASGNILSEDKNNKISYTKLQSGQ